MKKALITGITGQDGSYLAEQLLDLGYEVHGMVRRVALEDPMRRFTRISHLLDRLELHAASLESYASVFSIISKNEFDECYHLAAQSFRRREFCRRVLDDEHQHQRHSLFAGGAARAAAGLPFLLRRHVGNVWQRGREASDGKDPFHPRSPYGISKVAGYQLTRNYREAYGMFCVNGILFNHEGAAPRL
jgi:GDPmannose 4,6-dehydratase